MDGSIALSDGKNRSSSRDKRAKFVDRRRAARNAIRAIRVIGKLGNRAHYEYDDSDVKKIVTALNKEIDALKIRMTDQGAKVAVDFKLS